MAHLPNHLSKPSSSLYLCISAMFQILDEETRGITESQMAGPSGKVKDGEVLGFQGQEFFSQFLAEGGFAALFSPHLQRLRSHFPHHCPPFPSAPLSKRDIPMCTSMGHIQPIDAESSYTCPWLKKKLRNTILHLHAVFKQKIFKGPRTNFNQDPKAIY